MASFGPERFADGRAMLLGGLRQRHDLATAEAGIAAQWRRFLAQDALPGRIGMALYGVMCGSDASSLEYMCAVEVASLGVLPAGVGRMRVPAQRYAVFAHRGSEQRLGATWQQILDWLSSGSYASAHAPDFELYGPHVDPLAPGDGIEIWVGVVAREVGAGVR